MFLDIFAESTGLSFGAVLTINRINVKIKNTGSPRQKFLCVQRMKYSLARLTHILFTYNNALDIEPSHSILFNTAILIKGYIK